jgi:hypothetical protein
VVEHKSETIKEVPKFRPSGLRSDRQFVLDKVDSARGIRGSWKIGMQMPIPVVAGIKAQIVFNQRATNVNNPIQEVMKNEVCRNRI